MRAMMERILKEVEHPPTPLELTALQKLIVSLFIAGSLWVGATVQQTAVTIAQLEEAVQNVRTDPYRGSDAARDQATINQRIDGLEQRINRLDNR